MPTSVEQILEQVCDDKKIRQKAKRFSRSIHSLVRDKGVVENVPEGLEYVCAFFAFQQYVFILRLSTLSSALTPLRQSIASETPEPVPSFASYLRTQVFARLKHDLSCVELAKSTGVSLPCLACTVKQIVCRSGTPEKDDDEVKRADKNVSTPAEDVKQVAENSREGRKRKLTQRQLDVAAATRPKDRNSSTKSNAISPNKIVKKKRSVESAISSSKVAKRSRPNNPGTSSSSTISQEATPPSSASEHPVTPVTIDLTQLDDSDDKSAAINTALLRHIKLTGADITRYIEENSCADTELLLQVLDMKTRIQELDIADGDPGADVKVGDMKMRERLKQEVLRFARGITAYVKDHGCEDFDLRMKVLDLGTRLQLLEA
ncbi:hypothetical protein EIP86_008101 [Pleurotus ostreatoroseus]|nr:hypothetical protein EIP86_008101 [Pleurotus ostreatoroseus]